MAYSVTNNSPSAGYIAWADLNIQYNGASYSIVDGNTNDQFVWWDKSVSTTVLQTGSTLPTLIEEDCLVFLNKSGTAVVVPNSTVVDGALIVSESILAESIASNAITTDKLNANAVTSDKIGALEVVAGKIAAGAVDTAELAAGAITTDKLDANAVTTDKLAAGAITVTELADDAVSPDKLSDATTGSIVYGAGKGNFIRNGYGEYGDNTWFESFTYTPEAIPPTGQAVAGFAYGPAGDLNVEPSYYISISRDRTYYLAYDIRGVELDDTNAQHKAGMRPYDNDLKFIQGHHYEHADNLNTTDRLQAFVYPTDTTLKLEGNSVDAWYESSTNHKRSIKFHPYRGDDGHVYRDADEHGTAEVGYSRWIRTNGNAAFIENGYDDTGSPVVVTLGTGASAESLATVGIDLNPVGYFNNAGTASGDRFQATSATNLNTFTQVKIMACWSPNDGQDWGALGGNAYLGGFTSDATLAITPTGALHAKYRDSVGTGTNVYSTVNVDDQYNTDTSYGTNVPYRLWVGVSMDAATGNVDFFYCDKAEWDVPSWDFFYDDNWKAVGATVYSAGLDGMTWQGETDLAFGAVADSTNTTSGKLHALRVKGDDSAAPCMDVRGDEWTDGGTSFTGTDGLSYARRGTNETLVKAGGWPAGTWVTNGSSANSDNLYIAGSNLLLTNEWTHARGTIGGHYPNAIGIQGETAAVSHVPGARYMRLRLELNKNTGTGENPLTHLANVEFKELANKDDLDYYSVGADQMGGQLLTGENLVVNGSFEAAGTIWDDQALGYWPDGWNWHELDHGMDRYETSDAPTGAHVLRLVGNTGSVSAVSKAFPVDPTATYLMRGKVKSEDSSNNYYIGIAETTANPYDYSVHGTIDHNKTHGLQRDSVQWKANNVSKSGITSWTDFEYEYTPTAGVYWGAIVFINSSSPSGALYVDDVEVRRQTPTSGLADSAITTTKILPGAITTGTLAADAVTSDKIAANTIVAGDIAANTITATELAANTITAAEISAGTITTTEIATDTITANNLAANSVNTSELVAGSVTTNEIAANTIVAGNIAATTITAAELAADSVTAAKVAAFTMEAGKYIRSTNYDGTDYDTNDATAGWNIESTGGKAEFGQIRARGFLSTGGSGTQHVEVDDTSVNFFSGHTGENTHSEVVASTGGSGADEWPFLKLVTGKLGASLNQSYLYLYGESESGTYKASAKLLTNDTKLTVGNGEIAAETGRFVEHHQGASLYKTSESTTTATWDYPTYGTGDLIGGDEYGFFNDASDRLDVPTAFGDGNLFIIFAHCKWASNSTGMRALGLGKNGSYGFAYSAPAHGTTDQGGSGIIPQNADDGDYFKMRTYQNSGGNKSTNVRLACWFIGKEATGDSPAAGTSGS